MTTACLIGLRVPHFDEQSFVRARLMCLLWCVPWCAGLIGEVLLRSRAQHRCEALLLPAEGQGDGEGGKLPAQTIADSCCGRGLRLVFSAVDLGSESCMAVACWHLELSI